MTSRTTRRTRLIATVSATAGALALTLLPATAAQAAVLPPVPVFSFVDNGTLVPSAGSADGAATNPIVPAGYKAYDVDVTPDGLTAVMSLCNGSVAACTDTPSGSRFDATYGILLVHDEGAGVISSRLLTNLTSTNAAISADGSTVVWMYGNTLNVFDTGAVSNVEKYSTSTLAAPTVATELPTRVAVSRSGANVAVMYRDDTGATAGRVLAFPTAATTLNGQAYFQKGYPKTVTAPAKPLLPSSATFTFVGETDIVYNEFDGTNPQTSTTPRLAVRGTLTLDNGTPIAAALDPSLTDFYRLRQDPAPGGGWWAWKDVDSLGAASTTDATVSNIDNPLAPTPVIQTGPTRHDSATTFGYAPSTVAPPLFDATKVSNPAASHPTFGMSAAVVSFNGRTAYQTFNLYGGQPDGVFATNPLDAAETDRGVLERSYDGRTFTPLLTTSGAKAFVIGGAYFHGYVLNPRNTWYRWRSAGDAFTTPFVSRTVKVLVVPVVSVKVVAKGTGRTVTGAVTRPGGVVQMQRLVRGKWVPVVSAKVVKTGTWSGRYAFAKRALPRGSFRVVTIADVWAAQGAKVFKV